MELIETEENKGIEVKEETQLMTSLPCGKEMEGMMAWAQMMGETPFYKQMTEGGGKYAILAIFGAARELSIPPFLALNGGLWIVRGRVTLSSQMMGLLIRRRGHKITKKIGNAETCHLVGKRADTGEEGEMIFTLEQAKKIGLASGTVWKNYPDIMLYNRCLSMLAKQLFQDAIGNAVVEGEMDVVVEDVQEEPEPINKDSMIFIDRFNLLDLECPASKFIDSIAINVGQTRTETIKQCAKDSDKFEKNLASFIEKTQVKKELTK